VPGAVERGDRKREERDVGGHAVRPRRAKEGTWHDDGDHLFIDQGQATRLAF
jgi:hypothetical protein